MLKSTTRRKYAWMKQTSGKKNRRKWKNSTGKMLICFYLFIRSTLCAYWRRRELALLHLSLVYLKLFHSFGSCRPLAALSFVHFILLLRLPPWEELVWFRCGSISISSMSSFLRQHCFRLTEWDALVILIWAYLVLNNVAFSTGIESRTQLK